MGVIANIKGYINDEERGVYATGPSLLTWEEIKDMAIDEWGSSFELTNTIAELNQHATAYYDMLNGGGNLTTRTINKGLSYGDYPTINGISFPGSLATTYYIAYNNGNWVQAGYSQNA